MIRWMFRLARRRRATGPTETPSRFTRSTVADLRAAYARYPADRGIEALVTELLALSPAVRRRCGRRTRSSPRRPLIKRVDHPLTGPLEFECQILHIQRHRPAADRLLRRAGSPTQAAFRRLAELTSAGLRRPRGDQGQREGGDAQRDVDGQRDLETVAERGRERWPAVSRRVESTEQDGADQAMPRALPIR